MTAGLKEYASGKRFAVLGLGRTGIATAEALVKAGADVTAWDDKNRPDEAAFEIANLLNRDIAEFDALVMSPGIPHTYPNPHPACSAAKAAGVPLIGDVELLMLANAELPDSERRYFWGITGTNGKSTTTELVAHILKTADVSFSVGGNLGPAALGLVDPGPGGLYVLEMSSYQLELLDKGAFDVSAFLNLSPDHLERHNGIEGYTAAKRRIFEHLTSSGRAIISTDQDVGKIFASDFANRAVRVSTLEPDDISAVEGQLVDQTKAFNFDLRELSKFPGRHNWQNFAIAYAMCRHLKIDAETMIHAMRSFGGLAHRQEYVGELDGVTFVNDSKGTNPEATEVALMAYDQSYWIVGGEAKAEGIKPLVSLFGRIKRAYLIGDSSDAFADTLNGQASFEKCDTLDRAVKKAFKDAIADLARASKNGNAANLHNPVILLSPACASFDQFKSFEVRGDAFRSAYDQLKSGSLP